MTNYNKTVEYLYSKTADFQSKGAKAYKPGLENSIKLDNYFNNPHKAYKTIHIGGTNGKGSTSSILAAILQKSGYKVGLYTSPHIVDFRERIKVNGAKIKKQFVIDFVKYSKNIIEEINPSFFELTMEMALLYFKESQVDVAIIEVGLGGRLDSTNIIYPDLSIITNIGLDHMQFLGNSVIDIAKEKSGIIKEKTPVIIGEVDNEDVKNIFVKKADENNSQIIFAETQISECDFCETDKYLIFSNNEYPNLKCQLKGFAQKKNIKTVLTAIEKLINIGYIISKKSIYDGFANVCSIVELLGRWQIVGNNPKIICDGAHNYHAFKHIVKQLEFIKYNNIHIIFGMVNDKDISPILSILPTNGKYYFTKSSISRALDENLLKKQAQKYNLNGDTFPCVADAIKNCLNISIENDLIFIGGSFFIVADALKYFFNQENF